MKDEVSKLKVLQAYPLDMKVKLAERRIKEWYNYHGGAVHISFSGGKDSTVLLHLVRSLYPEVPAVFVDTGLEFPEIRDFVKTIDNVTWVKPKMSFKKVLETYGYPVVSKLTARYIRDLKGVPTEHNYNTRRLRETGFKTDGTKAISGKLAEKWRYLIGAPFKISEQCCDIMKKRPLHIYEKKHKTYPYIGVMASDSRSRLLSYEQNGCNSFNEKNMQSRPIMSWTEQDIWEYLQLKDISYSKIYDMGYTRTGCVFCMFGMQFEKHENRFQKLYKTHPKLHKYCMEQLGMLKVLTFMRIDPYPPKCRLRKENGDNI